MVLRIFLYFLGLLCYKSPLVNTPSQPPRQQPSPPATSSKHLYKLTKLTLLYIDVWQPNQQPQNITQPNGPHVLKQPKTFSLVKMCCSFREEASWNTCWMPKQMHEQHTCCKYRNYAKSRHTNPWTQMQQNNPSYPRHTTEVLQASRRSSKWNSMIFDLRERETDCGCSRIVTSEVLS